MICRLLGHKWGFGLGAGGMFVLCLRCGKPSGPSDNYIHNMSDI